MTDDFKARRDKAAEAFMRVQISAHGKLEPTFKAGADWCAKEIQADLALTRKMAEALLAEREQEIEHLKANSLGSFDVAVPSDEWYETERKAAQRDAYRAQAEKLARALEICASAKGLDGFVGTKEQAAQQALREFEAFKKEQGE